MSHVRASRHATTARAGQNGTSESHISGLEAAPPLSIAGYISLMIDACSEKDCGCGACIGTSWLQYSCQLSAFTFLSAAMDGIGLQKGSPSAIWVGSGGSMGDDIIFCRERVSATEGVVGDVLMLEHIDGEAWLG